MFRPIVWLKRCYYKLVKMDPGKMPMVRYWKHKAFTQAHITTGKKGETIMVMHGEDYPMMGLPRGHILFGPLSKLKHEIKQVFNESLRRLEEGGDRSDVIRELKEALKRCLVHMEALKYDLMPARRMSPAVKEIYRAWTKVAPGEASLKLRDCLCLILQEDDGYRYRVQWLAGWFPFFKFNPIKSFDKALGIAEHAEVIGDMKERLRLLRRILLLALEDPAIKKSFNSFFKEVNWNKVKLTDGDKYHFRGKYFKVDLAVLEY